MSVYFNILCWKDRIKTNNLCTLSGQMDVILNLLSGIIVFCLQGRQRINKVRMVAGALSPRQHLPIVLTRYRQE